MTSWKDPNYGKKWYQAHKNDPGFKDRAKAYRLKNRERININSAKWKEENSQQHLLSNAKYRAKKVDLEFDLDISDIVIPEYCPYLNTKLTSDKLRGHLDTHMSLDRIDSSKGYIKGNVEVISYKANAMKQDATEEQLLTFARNVLKRLEK